MSKKPDIFRLFRAINEGDYGYIDELSDEDVKGLPVYMILMWMHGAQSNTSTHVMMTAEHVNPMVFSLYRHPRLLLKLLVAANGGIGNTRYKFVKSTTSNESAVIGYIAKHYQCGYEEAIEIKDLLSEQDLKELKEIYGEQQK